MTPAAGSSRELPEPPGPIRMYFCGPTVYQRIHIGNARPFVLSMWLQALARADGDEVTLVENITDINDKIYAAAPGASAELAANASDWYVEDTSLLGLGRPDHEPKATETVPQIVALIEELVASGHAYPAGGDVYFRVASFSDYGRLSGGTRTRTPFATRPRRRSRGAEGGRARLRAVEGAQGGRGHLVGLALGPRPARLAHRVLRDGGGVSRARRSRSTAAAST